MSDKRFVIDEKTNYKDYPIILDTKTGDWWVIQDTMMGAEKLVDLLNEFYYKMEQLKAEKYSLIGVIDKNLLKGYHEQSIKHKEAKDKMEEGESSEVSPILDVIFYWTGYIKALEELKEGVSDE